MKRFLLFALLTFALPVDAQTVTVTSGAHDGFSRIVLTSPQLRNWKLTREDKGYVLTTDVPGLAFDTSDLFRRINNSRLRDVERLPDSGALRLFVDCECYAIPFEFSKNVLVIDINDGAAPRESSFELGVDKTRLPPLGKVLPLSNEEAVTTMASSEEWGRAATLPLAIKDAARITMDEVSPLPFNATPSLEETRDELLWQLSKGAAAGIVNIEKPQSRLIERPASPPPQSNIQTESSLGVSVSSRRPDADHMTGAGVACIANQKLSISDWANFAKIKDEFANRTGSLIGEFDRPDDTAVANSVRYYIALGFGAEARMVMESLKVAPEDKRILVAMSHIVDLELPEDAIFEGMEICDTDVALWAALAKEVLSPSQNLAISAILRAFSGLPLHLRQYLGPGLANRFLARGDLSTARSVNEAIQRAPTGPAESLALLEAELAIANGRSQIAQDLLVPLAGQSNPAGIQSTVTLINQQVGEGQEVSIDLSTTAEALLREATGGPEDIILREALAQAYASQNRFQDAFGLFANNTGDPTPIWNILADRGSDSSVIDGAILREGDDRPQLPAQTDRKLARRLLDMGFPDAALDWIRADRRTAAQLQDEDLLLTSQAELMLNNGIAALALLEGIEGAPAARLKAMVYASLQDERAVAEFSAIGDAESAARAARQQQNWGDLESLGQGDIWEDATALVEGGRSPSAVPLESLDGEEGSQDSSGPLAQTRAVLEESAAARQVLQRLLSQHTVLEAPSMP
jgi:hypothetical protein